MPDIDRLDTRRFSPEQLLLTTEEAAKMLSISRTTVYALMKSGDLSPVHIGRSCRISLAEVRRYVAARDKATDAAMRSGHAETN